MQLFKRMMLSLFPDEMVNNPVNPASMFVWFISAKQYFSVITRKIVENYKLNLFDISLDPYEVKIWFGDTPTIKVKDVDFYYGYAAAANLNGYRSFAPWQVAHAMALVASTYCIHISEEYEEYYTVQFIYAIYLLSFIFQAKVKQFPNLSREDNFTWFIELLFSLYIFLLDQSGKKYSLETVQAIKQHLLKEHIALFFSLYYFYMYCADSLDIVGVNTQQFFGWLFYDELKWGTLQPIAQDFMAHVEVTTKQSFFTTTEKNLIHLLFPADILIRYILDSDGLSTTLRHMVVHFFPKEKLQQYMTSFLRDDKQFSEFLQFITDYTHFKNSYFWALKKYMTHVFQKQDAYDVNANESIDELMSSIGEWGSIDMAQIPARLRQESETMEKLMNFYITYIWGYWIGRGDSWYVRCLHKPLLHAIQHQLQQHSKHDTLYYFSGLLYNYSKNVFYYKYAFENIRAWKEKFHLPFRATFREVYSNVCILKLFESNFVATILQDILPKDIKIYSKNPQIIESFAAHFQKNVSHVIQKKDKDLLTDIYGVYDMYFASLRLVPVLHEHMTPDTITALKESLYTIDYWMCRMTLIDMQHIYIKLQEKYGDASICGILATMRETLMWFYMYCAYVKTQASIKNIDSHIDSIMKFYVLDVLNISDEYLNPIMQSLNTLSDRYNDIIEMMNGIDDNGWYLQIARDNRVQYCHKKKTDEIFGWLSWEDIIWFRWFLKTLSYYNKRYVIPG